MIIPIIILLKNVTTMRNEAVMICIFLPFVSGIWKATTADLVSGQTLRDLIGAKVRPGNRCVKNYRLTGSSPILDSGIKASSGTFAVISRKISRRANLLTC